MSDTLTSTITWMTGVADTVTALGSWEYAYPADKNVDPTATYPKLFIYPRTPDSYIGSHDLNIGRAFESHNFTFEVLFDPKAFAATDTALSAKYDTAQGYLMEFLWKLTSVEYKNRFQLNHGEKDIPVTKTPSEGNDQCYSVKADVQIRAFAGTSAYTSSTSCASGTVNDRAGVFMALAPSGGSVNVGMIADFVASDTTPDAGIAITFTPTITGGTATAWKWDFGDGTGSEVETPSKTYTSAGTYTVKLWAANVNGFGDYVSKTNYIVASAGSLPLDLVADASFGIGFRKLRTAWAGSAVRLRRSTDNVEQDFGFSGTDLDTAGIATFLGGADGLIPKIHDQGLLTNDFLQSGASLQPQYSATAIGAKPGMIFTSDQIQLGSLAATTLTFFMVFKTNNPGAAFQTLIENVMTSGGSFEFRGFNYLIASNTIQVQHRTASELQSQSFAFSSTAVNLLVVKFESIGVGTSKLLVRLNKVEKINLSNLSPMVTSPNPLRIANSSGTFLDGNIGMCAIWPVAMSDANIVSEENEICTFYGI